MTKRWRQAVVAAAAGVVTVLAAPASAQVPPVPSETPCLPGVTCPSEEPPPSPSEAPSPTPSPEPSPSDSPTPGPSPTTASPSPTPQPSPTPTGGVVPPEPVDLASQSEDPLSPDVAPPAGGGGSVTGGGAGGSPYAVLVATDRDIAQALTGSAVILLLAAVVGSVAFGGTYRLTRNGVLLARTTDGGIDVETTQRWRTWSGIGAFVVAGIVAIVGFVRIAGEPLVPIQLVYLASTGLAVVILAAVGGALLVSEQLRSDEHRLREIERSLAVLAGHVAQGVADPPRLLDRDSGDESDE